jgi:Fuc2NAc and GlcNAc transferase
MVPRRRTRPPPPFLADMTIALLVPLAAMVASCLLTRFVLGYAIRRAILDFPNHRSSHAAPTPRGGGLGIAVPVLAGTAILGLTGFVPFHTAAAVLGGTIVAAVGWMDDTGRLRGRMLARRMLVYLVAAVWGVGWAGGLAGLSLGAARLQLGWAGAAIAVIGCVWMVCLFNFMDGIDGISGVEATTAGLWGGVLLWLSGSGGLAVLSLMVGAAAAGFLVWNWAPARIFMGDVGSCLLGFCFAIVALSSERAGAVPLLVWMILLGVFVFDATVTLLRRVVRGERWYEAHRSHAYQRAVQSGWSHRQVSAGVAVTNVALGVLATVAWRSPARLPLCLLAALVLLTAIYVWVERRAPMERVR